MEISSIINLLNAVETVGAPALKIVQLVAEVGVPAVKEAIAAFKKDTITVDDIATLRSLVQKPESYFDK